MKHPQINTLRRSNQRIKLERDCNPKSSNTNIILCTLFLSLSFQEFSVFTQTFLLLRRDGDLRKKAPVIHDSTQDPLVLQLLKEVNKLKVERQTEIPDWNQLRHGPLTMRILDTPSSKDKAETWLATLY
ncbi:hypothetical protein ACFX2C_006787 [Malus domestica]